MELERCSWAGGVLNGSRSGWGRQIGGSGLHRILSSLPSLNLLYRATPASGITWGKGKVALMQETVTFEDKLKELGKFSWSRHS